MSDMEYPRDALDCPGPGYDWRWRRAMELAEGDPHVGAGADDEFTRRAVRYRTVDHAPDVDDVRDAAAVHANGGLRRRALEAYLLTRLPDDQVAARTHMTPAAVAAYAALFFDVRGADSDSRELRAEARASDDPLVRAARSGGPRRVDARVRVEARAAARGHERPRPEERDDLLDELLGH